MLAVISLTLSLPVQADNIAGKVVGISDGDTITILAPGDIQERIRLSGIDAPEKRQPYGQVSKQALSALAFGNPVSVEWRKRDRYGRIVGKATVSGVDIGLAQVESGMAWHYKEYEREQLPIDRVRYAEAELSARAERRGLWQDEIRVPPWQWRRQ